ARVMRSAGLAGSGHGRFGPLPGDLQVVAFAESFDVTGDEILDILQLFLVGGFGPQGEAVWAGLQGAPAPAEADRCAGLRAFDVLHRGAGLRVAVLVRARRMAQAADLLGVPAELRKVPARAIGLDVGFGGQHCGPSVLGVAVSSQVRGWE